jgi:hypothetical protein
MGLLGEYIGAIHGQVRRKPFVIVRESINFEDKFAPNPNRSARSLMRLRRRTLKARERRLERAGNDAKG